MENAGERVNTGLAVGGAMVVLGALALWGEQNAALSDAILRCWPTGLIGLGVALLFPPERS